jgi:hypothetical protein
MMKGSMLVGAIRVLMGPTADAFTGNELHQHCKSNAYLCLGYTVGAGTMFEFQMRGEMPLCVDGVTINQVRDVVVKYLKDHPETRHEHALYLIARAMRESFACPGGIK